MNGSDPPPRVVTARMPSGLPVRVELAAPVAGDGMTSVGLRDLDLSDVLGAVGEIGSEVLEKVRAARPTRAVVELRFGSRWRRASSRRCGSAAKGTRH